MEKKDQTKPPTDWDTITIKNLYFRYEDEKNEKHNLDNINLELKRSLKIAFIGESGSGKSTLMTLLRGLENPNKVKVLIDGKRFETLKSISNWVTLIPQEAEIFENTIEYNVTAGVAHKKTEVVKACELACFNKVLKRLPKGIKTNIKEKGVNLSGGEKQRLALARGLFAGQNSSILILDEPTSSMDTKNELEIYDNLFHEFKDRCIVASVHRLHLLKKFDVIYLFDGGKLIERGNFELLKKNEMFQKIWKIYEKSLKSE